MSYEFKKDDVLLFASSMGAETRQKGNELEFKLCPYCGGNKNDKYTFSVNLETGAFCCLRASCGRQGHFVELARDFNYPLIDFEPKRYRKLKQVEIQVRNPAIEYMKSRGISEAIARRYKITTQNGKDNILVFPFFDENGVMVSAKYRKTDFKKGVDKNKEWFEHDTKPILFGMRQCVDFKTLVITEGQIDSLTLAECGIDNAVSVPTGARGFTWIENCYDFVDKFEEIIIFGDCEDGKITLVDGITKRFSHKKIKVVQPKDYLTEKDANDIYRKYGKGAILTAVGNAIIQPVKAVKDLADVKNINLMQLEHAKTGIAKIDKAIGGLYFGQVGLLTGKRGEGKSTFASQICANVLDDGYSIFAYSGELPDFHFKNWLDLQIAGSDNIDEYLNDYHEPEYTIKSEIREKISNWYRGRAYIFDNSVITENDEEISLLDTIEEAICRYGVKFILLDNLMTAIDVDVKDDLYLSQSKFVKKLKRIATKWEVFILVVAHPRKESGKELNNDSVSGSSDITNAVDIVFTYSRNTGEDKDEYQSVIGVTKNRLSGRLLLDQNRVKVTYSCKSKRIAETIAEKSKIYKCFDTPNAKTSVADEYVDILTEDDLGKVVDKYTFTL